MGIFFNFYIIFLIFEKYILDFFCEFVIQLPVHLAEGRYSQLKRRYVCGSRPDNVPPFQPVSVSRPGGPAPTSNDAA